jgi:predicted TIM-barrel fold metal-dependent hydrolase
MDRTFERNRHASNLKLSRKPSEFFRRQMHCTYIDDAVGVASRHYVGVDRIMWSSDYPHQASSWPHSQDVVARDFKDATAEDRFLITRGNAAKLYGFDA